MNETENCKLARQKGHRELQLQQVEAGSKDRDARPRVFGVSAGLERRIQHGH
jgi:hypothetical protein